MSDKEYPSAIATVDIIPFCYFMGGYKILLGRKKKHGGKLCFIGGFVDAQKDEDFLSAAKRELNEEVPSFGIECKKFNYLLSCRVDDPRYKDKLSKIYTSVFSVETAHAIPQVAGDDLDGLVWVNMHELSAEMLVPEHAKFVEYVLLRLVQNHQDEQ